MLLLLTAGAGLDDGLALTPPLGWRSYNAFGGNVNQPLMEAMMDAMVDRSRLVDGTPTSLADLAGPARGRPFTDAATDARARAKRVLSRSDAVALRRAASAAPRR